MIKIKFCGLQTVDDYLNAWKLGVDYVGFVCYEKSVRFIMPQDIKKLLSEARLHAQNNPQFQLIKEPKIVGLFVDWTAAQIQEAVDIAEFDIAQIYNESLENKINIPFWRVYRIGNPMHKKREYDIDRLTNIYIENEYPRPEAIIIDSLGSNLEGGTGEAFNWDILKEWDIHIPYFIAGGINVSNITNLLKFKPYGIDISSGIEIEKGKKDITLMSEIIKKVRYSYENNKI